MPARARTAATVPRGYMSQRQGGRVLGCTVSSATTGAATPASARSEYAGTSRSPAPAAAATRRALRQPGNRLVDDGAIGRKLAPFLPANWRWRENAPSSTLATVTYQVHGPLTMLLRDRKDDVMPTWYAELRNIVSGSVQ
jgi:hypothetical protein